jgi:protein-S-isoprenylcysteine O-methyltransferase Ste14
VLGRFLFRWRGVIGFLVFSIVFWLARPTVGSCLLGLPIVIAGLATRFWASGYIGIEGRVREIGMQSEERGVRREEGGTPRRRIVTGPYRILRHPLYIGNFLLMAGMLVTLRPALWLGAVVMVGFIVEYGLIIAAEEAHLAGCGGNADCRVQNAKGKLAKDDALEARGEKREAGVGIGGSFGRSQSAEGRRQKAEVRAGGQSPQSLVGSQESTVQRPESFLVSRAMCEWRTWVVTGVGFGLALLKAFITR